MERSAAFIRRRGDRFNRAFAAGGEIMSFLLARWTDEHAGELFAGADPVPTTLFMWHLAEEVEHKSSAFDVYEAVDGSRLRYALAMVIGTVLLGWLVWWAALVQIRDDGRLWRPVTHWRLFRWAVSLAFELFPAMVVSALPGHHPGQFADPLFLGTLLRQYDPVTGTMPLWESDCTKRLETIRDIPAGKCIYWFERTDMVKAFEVLGDVVALRGNLSPSLLTTGKPEEVDAAVRHLADNVFHKGGKLILDTAFGIPDETPVENVRAMFSAARRYAG
jgi:MFS family permease